MIYPWQQPQWQHLQQGREQGRLPHALLLTGPEGLGKRHFALQLAHGLLCQQPDPQGEACGQCPRCQLITAGNHPDFFALSPAEGSSVIKIDQIRALIESFSFKSQMGGYKVALIEPAERMNPSAANALLKTLEEPGEATLLILISSTQGRLPATIRSRCQKLAFSSPERALAVEWLRQQGHPQAEVALDLAMGAPLTALAYTDEACMERRQKLFNGLQQVILGQQDPVALAGKWYAEGLQESLTWMTGWVMDMIRLKSSSPMPAAGISHLANPDLRSALQPLAERLDFTQLFAHLDRLKKAGRLAETQVNSQLLLEDVLIPWATT